VGEFLVAEERVDVGHGVAAGIDRNTPVEHYVIAQILPPDYDTFENRNYQNFGCASQANFATQLADPKDLVTPRASSPVDAEQRAEVFKIYKRAQ
ncbi:MAG: CpaD family pilus assembly lipoprotein, partial [Pseudomonadota bacterium]